MPPRTKLSPSVGLEPARGHTDVYRSYLCGEPCAWLSYANMAQPLHLKRLVRVTCLDVLTFPLIRILLNSVLEV